MPHNSGSHKLLLSIYNILIICLYLFGCGFLLYAFMAAS